MRKLLTRPLHFFLLLAGINLVWRGLFMFVSQGSYTDGILQLECFRFGLTYWPPLFAVLARSIGWLAGLELAGRIVALLAGALAVFPIGVAAERLFGMRAARWALIAWTAGPLALRWSVQPMSDMPMTALWCGALVAALLAVQACRPDLFPGPASRPVPEPDGRRAIQWLLLASICGALGMLTRYQAALLGPLLVAVIWSLRDARRKLGQPGYAAWLTLLPWLAPPLWTLRAGIDPLRNHFEQIGQRAGYGVGQALLNYWFAFEEFVMRTPYFLSYGLFVFLLYGLFRVQWSTTRLRRAGWVALYLTLALLVLQSVFASFQSRYLLPLMPIACVYIGHGLATWQRHTERQRVLGVAVSGVAILWGLIFSALVGAWQGQPFLDLKQAAQFVGARAREGEGVRIFTNDFYNLEIGPVKTIFWSERDADNVHMFLTRGGAEDPVRFGRAYPVTGDYILVSSIHAGGPERARLVAVHLKETLPAEEVEVFARRALPLLPDIMEGPEGMSQNPLAVLLRYRPQDFQTRVLRALDPTALIEPAAAQGSDEAIEALREQRRRTQEKLEDIGERLEDEARE